MTSQKLNRLSRYWRRKLNRLDWRVSIEFVNESDMYKRGHVGECTAQICDQTAHIKILRDYATDEEIEWRIIHEWGHILYPELVPRDKTKAKLFEAGIDQMANSFLQFKYGKKTYKKE